MDSIEIPSPFHTQTGNAFEGYNLFNVEAWRSEGGDYFHLITDMNGTIQMSQKITSSEYRISNSDFSAEFINSSTILLGQMDQVALWNLETNHTQVYPISGHHDYEYNPLTHTFLTLQRYYVKPDINTYIYDRIVEYDVSGNIIWSFDLDSFIPISAWCPYRDLGKNEKYPDLTHSNSLFWDFEEDIIYLNVRNVNTFYKIDHATGKLLWGLGEYGDFDLYDQHGRQRRSLWYHGHAVKQIDTNCFILFDNNVHNRTNLFEQRSRILEITINETEMTAHISWSWTAPSNYYSPFWGDVARLPNGNRLGVFVSMPDGIMETHLVEIDGNGQIVWQLYYPYNLLSDSEYGIYRLQRFRRTPILSTPEDVVALPGEDVTVTWNTWYNFETKMKMTGTYWLFLNGSQIEMGPHVFDKFWRPTNLSSTISNLDSGTHNLTLALSDEGGHTTIDSVTITVTPPNCLTRQGPSEIELGENAVIVWIGDASVPLNGSLTLDGVLQDTFLWNGSLISYPLNSLEEGTYLVALHLFNTTGLVYEDSVIVTIYPTAAPLIHSFPADQSIVWNESLLLSWELFDYTPLTWSILVNGTLMASEPWELQNYQHHWNVPTLEEGRYNVTLVAYDHFGYQTARTTWLTVISPSPPVIVTFPQSTKIQWGKEPVILSWEIHGGNKWALWKNGTTTYKGEVTSSRIETQIEDWQRDWRPGRYNLTLQVTEKGGAAATHTQWLQIWVNFGDAYADSIITEASMWYTSGEQALGAPDGKFAYLFSGYGNGHVTLDMGVGEEIIDGPGMDFTVYASRGGGEYTIFGSNNLSAPMLVGNQVVSPLVLIGNGVGNTSFDLADSGLVQVRYIQIAYLAGKDVELDAVVAGHFNQPPIPSPNFEHWIIPISGIILVLSAMVVVREIRWRKQ